jgi:hypothetical protein
MGNHTNSGTLKRSQHPCYCERLEEEKATQGHQFLGLDNVVDPLSPRIFTMIHKILMDYKNCLPTPSLLTSSSNLSSTPKLGMHRAKPGVHHTKVDSMPKLKLAVTSKHKQTRAHHGVTTPKLYVLHLFEGRVSKATIQTLSLRVLYHVVRFNPRAQGGFIHKRIL